MALICGKRFGINTQYVASWEAQLCGDQVTGLKIFWSAGGVYQIGEEDAQEVFNQLKEAAKVAGQVLANYYLQIES